MLSKKSQAIALFSYFMLIVLSVSCSTTPGTTPEATSEPREESRLVLVLPKAYWQSFFPELPGEQNIFSVNWDGTDLRPLFNGANGYNYVEGVSFLRNQLLISSAEEPLSLENPVLGTLYIWDNGETTPVSPPDSFLISPYPVTSHALWLSDDTVIYIGTLADKLTLLKTQLDTDMAEPVLDSGINFVYPPWRLLAVSTDGFVYWQNGFITTETAFIETDYWRVRSNGEGLFKITTKDGTQLPFYSVSPDGSLMVLGTRIIDSDISNINVIADLPLENDPSLDYWSESGKRLFLSVRICLSPDCAQYRMAYYVWIHDFVSSLTPVEIDIEISSVQWSPDEKQLLLYSHAQSGNGSHFSPFIFDLESGELIPILTQLEGIDRLQNYHVFWEP